MVLGAGWGPSSSHPDSLNQPAFQPGSSPALLLGLCDPETVTQPVWSSHEMGFKLAGDAGQLARLWCPYAWDSSWQLKEKSLQGVSGK